MRLNKNAPLGARLDDHAMAVEMLVVEIGRLLCERIGANARETLDARMALRFAALEHADLRPLTQAGIETVAGRILDQIREPLAR